MRASQSALTIDWCIGSRTSKPNYSESSNDDIRIPTIMLTIIERLIYNEETDKDGIAIIKTYCCESKHIPFIYCYIVLATYSVMSGLNEMTH